MQPPTHSARAALLAAPGRAVCETDDDALRGCKVGQVGVTVILQRRVATRDSCRAAAFLAAEAQSEVRGA